jgi:hypothetical protein
MIVFLKFMATWEVWGLISFVLTIFPSFVIIWYLWPRKKIHQNVYINATVDDGPNRKFSKIIRIHINNKSNYALYVKSLGFKFGGYISPNQDAAKDHSSGRYEVNFEGPNGGDLSEVDTLVRANQSTATWIAVDNSIVKSKLAEAIRLKQVGTLKLQYMLISDKPSKLFIININL